MHRNLLRFSLLLLAAVSAVAQQNRVAGGWPSAERLREHVTFLASDKLEGRRTGTPGARLAAEYIVREFARSRLRPAGTEDGPEKRYLQHFPFVAGVEPGKGNSMLLTPQFPPRTTESVQTRPEGESGASVDLRLGEDWMPLGFSSNGRILSATLTFVGYGITAKELNYDDYAGAYIKGRVAVALAGTPDNDDPHGKFARYTDVRWKAIAAREAGALGLVVVAREDDFKQDALSRLRYDNSAGDAGLPVVVISRQVARRLLSGIGPTLADVEKAARASGAQITAPGTAAPATQSYAKVFSVFMAQTALTISVDIVRRNRPAFNVVGVLEGTDPKLKTEAIVIGAHYDHLGRGGSGSLAQREGQVHYGADDNASGVAGLLELARLFSAERPRRTIVFIAFGGEEEGLLGSNFYVNHPVMPLNQTVAMINMDMIGRLKDNKLIVGGVGTSQEWRSLVEAANSNTKMTVSTGAQAEGGRSAIESMPVVVGANGRAVVSLNSTQPFALTLSEDGYGPSDHASFYLKQVPVLFFWTGTHEDYHKPSDTAERINYEAEARIISFIASIVRAVDAGDRRPTFTTARSESAGRATGFRVYLGTIPNYADSNDGLKLDGVREDSPAAKAGLKAGDVIVRMAGRAVRNVYDYTYALGEMKAGEEYEVEILRDGKPVKLKLIPAARRQ